tara:strand:- start:515 stop:1015 length:501 start_codon:yes stop_codon:yes gene_type:complete
MKLNRNFYSNIAYGLLTFFFTLIIIYTFKFKMRVIQNLNFRDKINLNSNLENSNNQPLVEGFGQRNERLFKKDDDVFTLIERKLKGLTEELGGSSGQKDVKKILTSTKKICDMECAKCMMNMIEDNKGIRSIDLNKLADDDSSEDCVKCKKYTELSSSIKNMIDNL